MIDETAFLFYIVYR